MISQVTCLGQSYVRFHFDFGVCSRKAEGQLEVICHGLVGQFHKRNYKNDLSKGRIPEMNIEAAKLMSRMGLSFP